MRRKTGLLHLLMDDMTGVVAGQNRDITFLRAFDLLPAAVYATDAKGRITYFNEAAAEFWGCRPELGTSEWCGSWRLQTADGRPLPHDECPMAIAIKEGRSIKGAEAAAERPDGTVIPFLAFPAPMRDSAGKLIGAINMLVDITQHKRVEESNQRLAAIVESSDDAIVSKDLSGIVKSWNRGAERLFGYTAEEMIGKPITLLIPAERTDEEATILSRVQGGERVHHFDTVRRRKDGTRVQISLTVSPIRNAAGVITGASKIARDVSDRKESESRIRALMREVNHRVKNQFAVILSMVKETRKRAATSEEFESQIRDRIMALARSQDLLVEGEWRGATLHDLVVNQVQPFGDEDRIQAIGEPLVLSSSAVQHLGIAFHELATNSAKHGALSTRGGTVEIEWCKTGQGASHLRLTWTERHGPPVKENSRSGFGKVVLERLTPSGMNGVGHLQYAAAGIIWTLDAPLEAVEAPLPAT